jgi:ATP-binding cassette subfamily F protein 3
MLHVNDLTFRYGGRVLFDGATVAIPAGHKAGLVGRNGSGKSTLFRLIAGDLSPDAGSVGLQGRMRIGRVAQEAPDGPTSLLDAVLAADTERDALLTEAETAGDPHRIADIHTRLADIDAHSAPARAAAILSGLGFDEAAQARPLSDFSGGWRMRVALAGALFSRPDLLLLDEPTNHLDLEATLWLQGYLANWRGTLIVISHDRDLLNEVAEEIIHLDGGKLVRYVGNYDAFERTRRERLALQAKSRERQIAERERIQSFVDRFRAKATKARQAQSRLKMLARMEPIAAVVEERSVRFDFPQPTPLSPPIFTLEDASVGYAPDDPVLRRLSLRIDMDDRIGLIGANGNGKSTFLKLLVGELEPLAGQVARAGKLKVGYFAQHQTDQLDFASTPYRTMQKAAPKLAEPQARAHLGRFGFEQEKADTKIGDLSGGEKARLLFALMCLETPHMMLLDEPTNHLDVDAREALVQALNEFEGAVILVSHDPHLIEMVCDRLWLVADGTCQSFDGDLADYRRLLMEQRRGEKRDGRDDKPRDERKEARRERAQNRAETAHLRKAVKDAEKTLDTLSRDRAALEAKLADPTLYSKPGTDIAGLQKELARLTRAMEDAEHAWMAAMEALEGSG